MTAVFGVFAAGVPGSVWPMACAVSLDYYRRQSEELPVVMGMTSMDSPVSIPQTDPPRRLSRPSGTAIDGAIARVLNGGLYILGREVEGRFEAAFARFRRRHSRDRALAGGTDAL